MNLVRKEEEQRVRKIADRLSRVSSPIHHGRVKWDRKDTQDLVTIIKSLGKLKLVQMKNISVKIYLSTKPLKVQDKFYIQYLSSEKLIWIKTKRTY